MGQGWRGWQRAREPDWALGKWEIGFDCFIREEVRGYKMGRKDSSSDGKWRELQSHLSMWKTFQKGGLVCGARTWCWEWGEEEETEDMWWAQRQEQERGCCKSQGLPCSHTKIKDRVNFLHLGLHMLYYAGLSTASRNKMPAKGST